MNPPPDVRRFTDGQPIVVLRAADPRVNMALVDIAEREQSADAVREALTGPLRMVGWLVERDGHLMAVNGEATHDVQRGDVLAPATCWRPRRA